MGVSLLGGGFPGIAELNSITRKTRADNRRHQGTRKLAKQLHGQQGASRLCPGWRSRRRVRRRSTDDQRARSLRQQAWRLRGVARELEPRFAADAVRIAVDLENEAIAIETVIARIAALSD
jgi:hypothetical protein